MFWDTVIMWIAGALLLARGFCAQFLLNFLLAVLCFVAGVVFLVRKQRQPVTLLQVVLAWVCCGSFALRGLETRNVFDFLLAAVLLAESIRDSVLYGKTRKERQKEKD